MNQEKKKKKGYLVPLVKLRTPSISKVTTYVTLFFHIDAFHYLDFKFSRP